MLYHDSMDFLANIEGGLMKGLVVDDCGRVLSVILHITSIFQTCVICNVECKLV